MKKIVLSLFLIIALISASGFTFYEEEGEKSTFDLDELLDYQKEYETEQLDVCSYNTAKTYMDYRMTTVVDSRQYQFMRNHCTVDKKTGFLYDEEGFIAVALGSFYGEIGDRYYFTLETGIVLPLVKAEEKANVDTDYSGCYHTMDGSVIEFVIDSDYARNYFSSYSNGLVLDGNYNNYSLFKGSIIKVEKVLDTKREDYVTYHYDDNYPVISDIYYYASGY